MKRTIIILIASATSLIGSGQIIADHKAVEAFEDIPLYWINQVKKMHIYFAGASHSDAYRGGLTRLEDSNSVYQVNVGIAQSYTINI